MAFTTTNANTDDHFNAWNANRFSPKFFNDNKQKKRKSGKNSVTLFSFYWIDVTAYLFHLIKQNVCEKLVLVGVLLYFGIF